MPHDAHVPAPAPRRAARGRPPGPVVVGLAALSLAAAPARAQSAPAATGPCSEAAPTRGALRPDGEPRVIQRTTIELRSAEIRTPPGDGRDPGANVTHVFQAQGYLGLRTLEISDLRMTPMGRMVRYCTYPVVVSVEPASPAARAGIEPGDTLVAYNDRDLVKSGELELDRVLVPGEVVRVSLRREGRQQVRPVVVGRRQVAGLMRTWSDEHGSRFVLITPDGTPMPPGAGPARPTAPTAPGVRRAPRPDAVPAPTPPAPPAPVARVAGFTMLYGGGPTPLLGAQLVALDDDLREALGAREGAGVFVLRVAPGTHAFDAGLRTGDVVRAANGQPVATPLAIQRILAAGRQPGVGSGDDPRALRLDVERRGKRATILLRW